MTPEVPGPPGSMMAVPMRLPGSLALTRDTPMWIFSPPGSSQSSGTSRVPHSIGSVVSGQCRQSMAPMYADTSISPLWSVGESAWAGTRFVISAASAAAAAIIDLPGRIRGVRRGARCGEPHGLGRVWVVSSNTRS
ncbi:hypothetical protein [Amycolatopsis taiwanensis]|uniref:hypothetical protein n=1 Tax=Amycolatopsis taiwanensis TaxID=342230 RepID=UPI001FDEF606|nr:hypothetical protein [Amycolatopsis taiwanensis]